MLIFRKKNGTRQALGSERRFQLPSAVGIVCCCLLLFGAAGCQSPLIKDPNDPGQAGILQPDVLLSNLQSASDAINAHVASGDISVEKGREMLRAYADRLLAKVSVAETAPGEAWKYAEVLITAQKWEDARDMLKLALKQPPDEDRWVNDTLRLAHCDAELGDVSKAVALTKSTFRASPEWKWPILYATYLEIVPAALKHSHHRELELASLVEAAIHQHELATGDPSQERFKDWMAYRHVQIVKAWEFIASIYRSAGQQELARQALENARKQPTTVGV